MRTTLDIDDDVMAAAKELAHRERVSAGKIVSRLLREVLTRGSSRESTEQPVVAGFRPFPATGRVVTDGQINALRDSEGV
ncbi:MAG: hypothetical protein L6R30_01795 [Thermoanaerobaculia bacterium]|nr:hypothetical protein [Thermoanaerobaculia bacterium]